MPIRLRLALIWTALATLLVALGGVLFAGELHTQLVASLDSDLGSRAVALAGELQAGAEPRTEAGRVAGPQDVFVQVLSPGGRLVASSSAVAARPLLSSAQLAGLGTVRQPPQLFERTVAERARDQDTIRLMALRTPTPSGPMVVLAGGSLDPVQDAVGAVARELVIGGAIVLLITGLGAWLLAGAALRPVERLRRQTASISDQDGARCLPVPRTRDELAALATTMNSLLVRLQTALAHERRLVADAAHELRSPLAILRTELDLAGRPGRTRAELRSAVDGAARETERLVRLTEDLLFLARTDEGLPTMRPEPQLLATVLRPPVEAHALQAAARGVTCLLDIPDGLACCLDEARVRQALENLLENALRVAPPGSRVEVAATTAADRVVISVSDRGPGFSEDFLPHAFERFRRADEARTREDGGTGLGLAIVEAIARGHGGTAEAGNRPGGGATVRFSLLTAAAA